MALESMTVGKQSVAADHDEQHHAEDSAAAAVCTVPIIIAFLIFQKRITEGIAMTGIKG